MPAGQNIAVIVLWAIILIGGYFLLIRPQKKQEKQREAMVTSLAVGDSVLTTAGFYGVVIDIPDDNVVIVEFGGNKNCRIPMKKDAIVEVESANK
ncbi:preprotein translocase subunit YajC [Eubacterium xylanophilum]|uniref:preprotein translocase subunit YajC n=1 Tax=Eubacterium xylanophilum TaxID=39497 RepID=UPI00047A2D55|nr:preprotein translocase subunit YajC [Eubacterium xylanophilum]